MKRATILTATLALLFLTCTGAKASAQNDTTAAQTAAVTAERHYSRTDRSGHRGSESMVLIPDRDQNGERHARLP